MIDAAIIGERLAACKRDGMSWESAWSSAVGLVPRAPRRGDEDDEPSAARFAYEAFRAHYLGEDTTVHPLSRGLATEDDSAFAARGRTVKVRDAA